MKIVSGTKSALIIYGLFFLAWVLPESIYLKVGVVIRPIDIAAAILIAVSVFYHLSQGSAWFYRDRTVVIIGMLILWGASSFLWAEHKSAVLPEVIQWLEVLLLFVSLSFFLKTEDHLKQFIVMMLSFAVVVQLVQGIHSLPSLFHLEPYIRERPDPFFSVVLIVYLGAFLIEGQAIFRRSVTIGLISLSIVNLFFSLTRKGIVGCAVSLVIMVVLSSRSAGRLFRRTVLMLGTVAMVLFVMQVNTPKLWDQLSMRFKAITLQDEHPGSGIEGRLTHVAISANIFREHPWAGLGLGNHHIKFREFFIRVFEKKTAENIAGVHNGFLLVLSELGLVGIGILMLLFLRPIRLISLFRKRGHSAEYPGILLGSAALFPFVIIKFGTAHAGIGRIFPLIFLLVLTNAYERFLVGSQETVISGPLGVTSE
ncbi:O-antigen ligase family protein [Thermodesulfobacteriota bacterium]